MAYIFLLGVLCEEKGKKGDGGIISGGKKL